MPDPRVSVIVPVRDRARYVGAAIASILRQSYGDYELVVIDDGSTDESRAVVEPFARDPRVRIEPNPGPLGIPKTRNRGLALARGEYVAMLDSDDVAAPDRLARQVAFLDRHRDHALVGTWTAGMDASGRSRRRLRVGPVTPDEVRARLLFQCCPAQSTIMARTDVLRRFGYREDHVVSSDFDLWLRLSRVHALGNLPAVMVRSRMHADRVTRQKADLVRATCLAIMETELADLGVQPTPADLDLHYRLPRVRKRGVVPDRAFLLRGARWLSRLLDANDHAHRYDPTALAREIGRVWLVAWWSAPAHVRAATLPAWMRSRLRPAVASCAVRTAELWTRARRAAHAAT